MIASKNYRGRPILTVRLDPERLSTLRETAQLQCVSPAEVARAMIAYVQEQCVADKFDYALFKRLLGPRPQMDLPLEAPVLAQKPASGARKGSGRSKARLHR